MKKFIRNILAKNRWLLTGFLVLCCQDLIAQFQNGDVFIAVSNGQVQRRSSTGTLLQTLNTTLGGYTTGMAFDAADNLYVTNFSVNSISKFNNMGVLQGIFGSGNSTPESIVFDGAGNAYVGNLGNGIRKFDAAGNFLSTSFGGRVDWLDIAADQCTVIYGTEGNTIFRHNVCTNTALPNFTVGTAQAFAMRIRQNGEVLLADRNDVKRYSAAGVLLQTYTVAGENSWFALNLSPDGTSFWSANIGSANVYRIDIATGTVLTSFNTGTGSNTVFGLTVFGEFQAAVCALNQPPVFTTPTPTCGSIIQANAGSPVNFTIAASDPDAANTVTLSATGLPAAATMTPNLPTTGNPVSSAFSWTPSFMDAGTHVITFKAADDCAEISCTITIEVQACQTQAVCKNATVTLVNGTATVTAADVDGGSTATCGIQSMTVSPATFGCSDIGDHQVTLTVTDVNGTTSTCNATVTVVGQVPSCSINAIPSNNTYTGGVPTNIYLGYGPQSVTLDVTASGGGPFTYSWSPATGLSSATSSAPVFTPSAAGVYVFTVTVTNSYGCTTTCEITICVQDVRVPGTDNKKVYVCHNSNTGSQTLSVSINAVATHLLGHGDRLGDCNVTSPCDAASRPVTTVSDAIIVEGLNVNVQPNPTSVYFNLFIRSNEIKPISLRISDINGRLIYRQINISPNSSIRVGEKLPAGTYYAEIKQGAEIRSVKLIKVK